MFDTMSSMHFRIAVSKSGIHITYYHKLFAVWGSNYLTYWEFRLWKTGY